MGMWSNSFYVRKRMNNIELLVLDIVCKQMYSGSFKNNVTNKLFADESYLCVSVHEQDLRLNNLQGLICRKTRPTNQNFV